MNGKEFFNWRRRMEWTQGQAATALGVHARTIVNYEGDFVQIPQPVKLATQWLELQMMRRRRRAAEKEEVR